MRLTLHPAAVQEISQAFDFYLEKDPTVAEEFLEQLNLKIDWIGQFPQRYPVHEHETRRVVLQRFPFQVVYTIRDEDIVVIAVAHTRRRPGYWSSR